MTMVSIRFSRNGGFTLMEMVITMVLIGILSAVALTNLRAQAQHSVTVQADQLRRDLSHIQLLAISRASRLRLTVNTAGTNYTVTTCPTGSVCTNSSSFIGLIDPATGVNFSVALTDGATLSPANSILDFDSLGRPQSAGSLIATIPAVTYTLSGSGRSVLVKVLPITGFALTSY